MPSYQSANSHQVGTSTWIAWCQHNWELNGNKFTVTQKADILANCHKLADWEPPTTKRGVYPSMSVQDLVFRFKHNDTEAGWEIIQRLYHAPNRCIPPL